MCTVHVEKTKIIVTWSVQVCYYVKYDEIKYNMKIDVQKYLIDMRMRSFIRVEYYADLFQLSDCSCQLILK